MGDEAGLKGHKRANPVKLCYLLIKQQQQKKESQLLLRLKRQEIPDWCCKQPPDRKQGILKLHFERDPTKNNPPTSFLELLITFLGGFIFCKV